MEPYRQAFPSLGLAIERGTPRVPSDGHYYVLFQGEVQGRHRSLKQAQAQYRTIFSRQDWKPEPVERAPVNPALQAVERYMDALEDYWGSASEHRRRGGKTMYRS
jgi:hypothetical protein